MFSEVTRKPQVIPFANYTIFLSHLLLHCVPAHCNATRSVAIKKLRSNGERAAESTAAACETANAAVAALVRQAAATEEEACVSRGAHDNGR
jgi:hypothetical protein